MSEPFAAQGKLSSDPLLSPFRNARQGFANVKRPSRKPRSRQAAGRQLVILTGLSGSGKSTVLKAFEDMGYYCVDNLPVELIPIFAELHAAGEGDFARAALLVDAREGLQLEKLPGLLTHLRRDHPIMLVYIEAHEDALLRRYSETRRPHPLGRDYSVRESLEQERALMEPIRKLADVVIDTSQFNVHELRHFVNERFKTRKQAAAAGFAGEFWIQVWRADGRGFDVRRALSAESAFCDEVAAVYRQRCEGATLHRIVSADGGVFAADAGAADVSDSALH